MHVNGIVTPTCLQLDVLSRIHQWHLGIVKCRLWARTSVWWPGISTQINEIIQNCKTCYQNFWICSEPMIPSTLPQRPWEKIRTDLFEQVISLLVDYFSKYIVEVVKLTCTTTYSVLAAMKPLFARHGIPDVIISDNGRQYSSQEFQ